MQSISAKHFFFIRHGESEANLGHYASGSFDSLLTEKGRRQAQAARRYLEEMPIKPKRIVHSHLSRAKDTAFILNEGLKLPMQENEAMGNRSFGDWKGEPIKVVRERIKSGLEPPNGESYKTFEKRVMDGLAKIMEYPDEPVLIVTHSRVIDAFLVYYGQKMDVKNCHVYEFLPQAEAKVFPWKICHHPISE